MDPVPTYGPDLDREQRPEHPALHPIRQPLGVDLNGATDAVGTYQRGVDGRAPSPGQHQ